MLIPHIPPEMPALGNRLTRFIGRALLRLLGWRVVGDIPAVNHCMVAAAPHTSNWDFFVAMPAILALGLKISFLMKKEAFFWPLAGLAKYLGAIPTDRSSSGGVVGQIATAYGEEDKLWVAIAPEGTRSKVVEWKSGFLRIAHQAQVPVLLIGWDYPSKTILMGKVFETTGDFERDLQEVRRYYRETFTGKRVDRQ